MLPTVWIVEQSYWTSRYEDTVHQIVYVSTNREKAMEESEKHRHTTVTEYELDTYVGQEL